MENKWKEALEAEAEKFADELWGKDYTHASKKSIARIHFRKAAEWAKGWIEANVVSSVPELKKQYEKFCKEKSTLGYHYGWHASNVWDFLEVQFKPLPVANLQKGNDVNEPSGRNNDEAVVASHTCTTGNTIEQLKTRLEWGNNFYEKGYGYINPEKFGLEKAIEILKNGNGK